MCPSYQMNWSSSYKTCSNFPVSGILLDNCCFSKKHHFKKPHLSLLPKGNINIFSLLWMHLQFLTMSILDWDFSTWPQNPWFHGPQFFKWHLISLKKVNFKHSLSALECPKITAFKTMASLYPKKYGLARHFLQLPLSPALVGSL